MTQEALKHLKAITEAFGPDAGIELDQKAWAKLHTAIKEALAQPEQEPVALETLLKWDDDIDPIGEVVGFIEGSPYIMVKVHKGKQVSLDDDLYATPPQRTWVGLTDEDRKQISKEANYHWEMTTGEYAERIGQLTEAKLKERNA